jgi:hypothetical protein
VSAVFLVIHVAGRPKGTNKINLVKPELLKLLRSGVPVIHACAAVGIPEQTFYGWIRKGKESTKGQHFDFYNDVQKAKADAVTRNVALIQRAAQDGTWQASAWYLERCHPNEFGKQEAHKLEHSGGLEVNVTEARERITSRINSIASRVGENENSE